jgi:hypothetical protein
VRGIGHLWCFTIVDFGIIVPACAIFYLAHANYNVSLMNYGVVVVSFNLAVVNYSVAGTNYNIAVVNYSVAGTRNCFALRHFTFAFVKNEMAQAFFYSAPR